MSNISKLAEQISSSSLEFVFGIPGSGLSLQLLDILEKCKIKFVRTHMEATAPLMAAGAWIATGKPSAAISIRGPGITNMLPGIAACHFERLPVITISEAVSESSPPELAHKRINHREILKAVSKRVFYLSEDFSFSDILKFATNETPGPVHIELCAGEHIEKYSIKEIPPSDDKIILSAIHKSVRPVVIVGTFANRRPWRDILNRLKIPVFTTAAAKGAVDESSPHVAGIYTGVGLELSPEHSLLPQADLIVGIGLVHNEVLSAKPFNIPSINIINPDHISRCSGFAFQYLLDEGRFKDIAVELSLKNWGTDDVRASQERLRKTVLIEDFSPVHVFESIERTFKGCVRIGLDTGNFCVLGEHFCRIRRPDFYLSSGQGRYMGIGIPLAIGAAIHDRLTPTVVCVGDGSIGMFFSELKIVAEMNLPICIILMRDAFFASVRATALAKKMSDISLKIANPSWIKAVESFGIKSLEATDAKIIEDSLKRWNPAEGPLYIEAVFNPNTYMNATKNIR
jgi:acetolactate synthase-1/2/3 large subunit